MSGARLDERVFEIDEATHEYPHVGTQVQPEVGRHLVVAASAGSQLTAERPQPFDEAPLQRGVDVFVRHGRAEFP
jgi:hypothetical protein